MKKIFTVVATVLATVSLSATVYTPAPGENTINAIMASLQDGDTIVLSTGTYYEWTAMTFENNIVIIAAPDAKPVLYTYSDKIKADFEINGIELVNISKDNYLLRTGGNVAGKIVVKNCSFQLHEAYTKATSYLYLSSNSVGELEIDNCIFKENPKDEVAILAAGGATIGTFTMTNCTAYGAGAGGDLAVRCENATNIYVDHCTFYNCGKRPIYLTGETKTSYLVQNCIFSAPDSVARYCVATYAGDVKNCMYYKYQAPRSDNATITACVYADPQFTDAAKADFTLKTGSPALTAGTDGGAIGDPRWVKPGPGTKVENVAVEANAVKTIVNGQVVIIRDGVRYNAIGQMIK